MRALPGDRPQDGSERAGMADRRRRRILRATAELVAERGYLGFTVEELISRAGVSLLTLRKLYGDKEGCYLALLDHAATKARRKCAEAIEAVEDGRREKVGAAIGALFEAMAAHPEAARACLVEPFAAGVEAIDRHRRALGELGAMLLGGVDAALLALGCGVAAHAL